MKQRTYFSYFLFIVLAACPFFVSHAESHKPSIVVLGDSLSAAYGIAQKMGWVSLLQERLNEQHYFYDVVNASISGDTTSGALTRLERTLEATRPSIIVIELGGNDGLRGLSLETIRTNIAALIEQCLEYEAQVLLVGMKLPPNYGPAYTKRFHELYRDLAQHYQIPLLPFLLEGIAEKQDLMQEDGIHPRAEAQQMILDNVWQVLEPMLDRETISRTAGLAK